jgi:ectoine hydroxylase-related dioxygenase (phytanoyl-CoA dioxygenase family)
MMATSIISATQMGEIKDRVQRDGFALVPNIVDDLTIASVLDDLQLIEANEAVRRKQNLSYGIRNFVNLIPSARRLANSETILSIARAFAGERAQLVRSLFFDKNAEANWKVQWHQDLTIAVKARIPIDGFGPWSVKAGIPHVQPPDVVLEGMIALRIHLDQATETNGALKVYPGSQHFGRLPPNRVREFAKTPPVTCTATRGSILAMRPLLLHSSSAGTEPTHRRVIHLEFAGVRLPQGLEWNE